MSTNPATRPLAPEPPPLPWWHFRIVWFALGLPAVVVIAALFTVGIAVRHADPVVVDPPAVRSASPLEPAQQARNHAATPAR